MDPETRQKFLAELGDEGCLRLKYDWPFWARPNQLCPEGDWNKWLIMAGRGFGKTRIGSETIRSWAENGICKRIALVAEDAGDARDVMVEGESGIIACSPPWFKPHYEPSKRRLTWPNGASATLFSADDPEALRGPQFDGAWCDELAKWRYAQATWDMLQFGMRLGRKPRQVITTTPRPVGVIKELLSSGDVFVTKGSTYDNRSNLAENFFQHIIKRYEGTRLGRQELNAELLLDNPYALWNLQMIDGQRLMRLPEDLTRIMVAVDPPITASEDSDECGIIIGGIGVSEKLYILGDYTVQGASPAVWAKRAVEAVQNFLADGIVAEANQGGEMVKGTLTAAESPVKIKLVKATRGKVVRAEPISALYEQGRVSHVGSFPQLEDQMCEFTSNFDRKSAGYSPDRVDALVWLLTELALPEDNAEPRIRQL